MRERAALLNLVAELRGRIDELQRMIETAPDWVVATPSSYDEEGVVDLTPAGYSLFRAAGLDAPFSLGRYKVLGDFMQFGAPEGTPDAEISAFALSDLHRTGPDPAWGLRFVPQDREKQSWYTFELLADAEGLAQYQWQEWVLKISAERPLPVFVQFVVEGQGFMERVNAGTLRLGDFAAFHHVRLDRASLIEAAGGRPVRRIRLTLATDGTPTAFDLYAFSLFARQ